MGYRPSQLALVVKNPPASAGDLEMRVRPLGGEDPLEEGMVTHSSILAWRIPWTQEPGGHGPQSQKESDRTEVGHDSAAA